MITKTEKIGSRMVIRVLKDIDDMKSGEEFKAALMDLYNKGEKEIVIDFDSIHLINSHGIGKILMFYKRLKQIGGNMYVSPLKGNMKEIFESLMLNQIIPELRI
jgi:anti-anti-sigma factor